MGLVFTCPDQKSPIFVYWTGAAGVISCTWQHNQHLMYVNHFMYFILPSSSMMENQDKRTITLADITHICKIESEKLISLQADLPPVLQPKCINCNDSGFYTTSNSTSSQRMPMSRTVSQVSFEVHTCTVVWFRTKIILILKSTDMCILLWRSFFPRFSLEFLMHKLPFALVFRFFLIFYTFFSLLI